MFDLRFREIFGQAHPGSIVEGLLDSQVLMDSIILRDQLIACIRKPKWADTNDITRIEFSDPDRLCIDIHVIRTAQINDAMAVVCAGIGDTPWMKLKI